MIKIYSWQVSRTLNPNLMSQAVYEKMSLCLSWPSALEKGGVAKKQHMGHFYVALPRSQVKFTVLCSDHGLKALNTKWSTIKKKTLLKFRTSAHWSVRSTVHRSNCCLLVAELPEKPILLPPFVDSAHRLSYHLTRKGRSVTDRVVCVLGFACPDITYSPAVYPIAALLLHFMSGESIPAPKPKTYVRKHTVFMIFHSSKTSRQNDFYGERCADQRSKT